MYLIASKIKETRIFLRLSQGEFASKSGMTQYDVSSMENGKKKFIPTSLLQFLISSGISLAKLLDDRVSILRNLYAKIHATITFAGLLLF